MEQAPELVTVYRSMDDTAKEDCCTVLELLTGEGLSAVMVDDETPGVPEGVYEVRVPPSEASEAEQLIADNPPLGDVDLVDDAPELGLETIYHSEGSTTAEIEAIGVQNVLEAGGIASVLVGDSVLPNLPFEVRVAKEQADAARGLVEEALQAGPAAAAEAELESERGGAHPEQKS